MENIQRYELKKISSESDEYAMVLYINDQNSEFSDELGQRTRKTSDFTSIASQIIKEQFPKMKVTVVKVILGGLVVASIPLFSGKTNVEASTTTNNQVSQLSTAYYKVVSGDTLWNLSIKFGTSVDNIKKANNLTLNTLQVHQQIIIPKAFHVVVSGDYLSTLAKKYGTTVEAIKEVNKLSSDSIRIGQTLIIPILQGGQTTVTMPAKVDLPHIQTENQTHYTVVSGDTLSLIAKRLGTTVEAIRTTNNLTSDLIRVGQLLVIHSSSTQATMSNNAPPITVPVTSVEETVSPSIPETPETGDVSTSSTTPKEPAPEIPTELVVTPDPTSPETSIDKSYTVVSGDTLSVIAKRNNVTLDQIKSVNQLTSDMIRVGQVLIIPNTSMPTTVSSAPVIPIVPTINLDEVEKNLRTLGYLAIPASTGTSGLTVTQAIKNFQMDYGLPVTGTVDEGTNVTINHAIVKKQLIKDSVNYVGVPYLWGGTTPSGFDCSGYVYYMFNQQGVKMPRSTSSDLFKTGTSIGRAQLQPGDLVFFAVNTPGVISHVGFYLGNNQFISATSSKGIAVVSMDNTYWAKYYVGAKRIY